MVGGSITEVKDEQLANADLPRVVIDGGSVTDIKDVQL